jgi:ankyrin repeat protein
MSTIPPLIEAAMNGKQTDLEVSRILWPRLLGAACARRTDTACGESLSSRGVRLSAGLIFFFRPRQKLLAEGADINQKTVGGMTALHWAVVRGHYGIVKALVERKADLKIRTPSGMAALDEAIIRGRLNVVKLLDEHGVNVVDEPNYQGDLPVHTAAREGMLPILKFLIEEKHVNVMQNNKVSTRGQTDNFSSFDLCSLLIADLSLSLLSAQVENKRPLNLSRQSLHDRPNEPQHRECTHYLFDKDETG